MCGNGARCLALFAANLGLGTSLQFNVHDTIYEARVSEADNYVQIAFPMRVDITEVRLDDSTLYQMHAGTEHIVQQVGAQTFEDDELLAKRGRQLRYHQTFNPPGTNVNFIQGTSDSELKIKTYERGVENLTLACGTGAVAGAIGWHHINDSTLEQSAIDAQAEGGKLNVEFNFNPTAKTYSNIILGGPAQFVFNGTLVL